MSSDSTIGLEAWEARRKAWTTANELYKSNIDQIKERSDKNEDLLKKEEQRIAFYRRLVLHREAFQSTIGLQHVIPVLVTGWQDDGLWPKGMTVQDRSD